MTNPKLRHGRYSETGAYYAVTVVSLHRRRIFNDPALAAVVSGEIACAAESGCIATQAWVVMPDHVHWLLAPRSGVLSRHMQAFKSRSAIAINRLRGMQGPVWQSGYYDHRLRSEEDLLAQARYIVANPLRRGLVERIEQYPHWGCAWVRTQEDLLL